MPRPRETPSADERPWQQLILEHVGRHPHHPLKPRALARALGIPGSEYTAFRETIRALLDEGDLTLGPGRTLRLPAQSQTFTGVFRANRRGFGFVQTPGRPDLYVAPADTRNALDGDEVLVRLRSAATRRSGAAAERIAGRTGRGSSSGRGRGSRRGQSGGHGRSAPAAGEPGRPNGQRAEVVRIIRRAPIRWVGQLETSGGQWWVRPRGNVPVSAVRVSTPEALAARPGDLVMVAPSESSLYSANVRGVITERIGDPADYRNQVRAIIRRCGIPEAFPAEVSAAARRVAAEFDPASEPSRLDLRSRLIVTIDPPDARDFDDAISLDPGEEPDTWELGVHIADVAHFVRPGDPLDVEAKQRGVSVYFPGYVVPMLPEALSSGVCSLQPGEPRYTRSVFMTYDRYGRVRRARFARSLIGSQARLTYEEVEEILAGRTRAPAAVAALLHDAAELARRIQQRRLADGMIALALPEVSLRFDAAGRVVSAGPAHTGFSHTLIEMFMVETNEAVSRHLGAHGLPHLRRVHPELDSDEAGPLRWLLRDLGRPELRLSDRAAVRALLDAVRGRPEETAAHYVLLRSFAQARYSPSDEGHYALASEAYCHFTSPIRRYPDLTVHRLLDRLPDVADEGLTPDAGRRRRPGRAARRTRAADEPGLAHAELTQLGLHLSQLERRAQQAEREARHVLLLELMKRHLGETFDGFVTGVTPYGVFVQIQPQMAEGLIRAADLGPSDWTFDPEHAVLISRDHGRVLAMGQTLRVVIAEVDDLRSELLLLPAPGCRPGAPGRPPKSDGRPPPRRAPGERRTGRAAANRAPRRGPRRP